ncbi:hypothetical protein A2686_02600 [Candidatus Woesebacteria bacterium RIFCSPHIGHO2_01_FULL_38_10]|uniref:Uncharacterized protein n=1 Tax=Candidatus Woesebacteria bacterium RIFCSPLOWO2_01_FULL_39_10b TaxID=1802517 RepID=A0A1F8BAS2_9BACT|nr:MAG: hypothetical protein A2686_02600 [Candidatus Woesebacteria bacterium RIFCSPHIGHO2_01_FULL_38_10]OGM60458.1 MAG: hypothetical protein A2892_00290 [Candidatus Woesebacteria bacterium RIFCSPLOWO2_01_FULL_39_10b]
MIVGMLRRFTRPPATTLRTKEGVSIPVEGEWPSEEEIDFADMLARRLLQSKLSREPRTLSIQGEELQGVLFKTDSGPIIVTGNFIAKVTADGKLGRLLPRTPGSTSAKK